MKMSNAFLCCDSCFEKIGMRSSRAAKFWIDLCAIYTKEEGTFAVAGVDDTLLRQLETMGYIVSTELYDHVLIKVCGQQEDTVGIYYCPRGCQHE